MLSNYAKKVSVIICTKNVESFILDCVKSVILNNPYEIIIVDGESTDKTLDRIKKYDVKVFSDKGNGLSYARRVGVNNSSADFILFIGPDNILKKGFIDKFVQLMLDWNFDASTARTRVNNPIGYWDKGLDVRWRLLTGKPGNRKVIGTPGMYKRSCFNKINFSKKDFGPCDDTVFSKRMLDQGLNIGSVPITLYDQNGTTFFSLWNRFKWYGLGDYLFYNYNCEKWNIKRKFRSIFHPLTQNIKFIYHLLFSKDFIFSGALVIMMLARYYGWINQKLKHINLGSN